MEKTEDEMKEFNNLIKNYLKSFDESMERLTNNIMLLIIHQEKDVINQIGSINRSTFIEKKKNIKKMDDVLKYSKVDKRY